MVQWLRLRAHNAGNSGSIPYQGGRFFTGGPVAKNPPANAGDVGSIPGSGRSLGGGNGNPF